MKKTYLQKRNKDYHNISKEIHKILGIKNQGLSMKIDMELARLWKLECKRFKEDWKQFDKELKSAEQIDREWNPEGH